MSAVTTQTNGLGDHIAGRRLALGISQAGAAKLAGVSRTSWVAWEKGTAVPEDYNHIKIETVLRWQPGSVAAILAGGQPTPVRPADPLQDPEYLEWRNKFQQLSARYGRDEALRLLESDNSSGQNVDKFSRRHDAG